MVTLVPPDSGPLPGVSASIEGVCREQKLTYISLNMLAQTQDTVCLIHYLIMKNLVLVAFAE